MPCDSYESCSGELRDQLRHPTDEQSLYASKIYDNQTANRRCYESNPINIVEGFTDASTPMGRLMRMVVVAVALYLLYIVAMKVFYPQREVSLGVGTVSDIGSFNLPFLGTGSASR